MRKRDTWLLLLSLVVIFISLYRQKDYKISLLLEIPIDTNNYDNSHYPKINEYLPLPIITDIDGDGKNEIIYVTNDYRLIVLETVTYENIELFRLNENELSEKNLLQLPIKYQVSLKSEVGLATGRRPTSIKTGFTSPYVPGVPRQQIIVVVTDGWSILCFNHQLKKLWESYASDEVLPNHYQSEISISIVPNSDKGMVIIGGRMEPMEGYVHKSHYKIPMYEGKIETNEEHSHERDDDHEKETHRDESHFSYFAYDGEKGYKIWSHEENDFMPVNKHTDEEHRKESDVSLHSFKQHIYSQLDHLGEVDWRTYRDSVLAALPHKWSTGYDTKLDARHFSKKINTVRGNVETSTTTGLNNQEWDSELIGVNPSNLESFSILKSQDKANFQSNIKDPNVIVAHNKNGLEVVQISSGNTLCRLVLDSSDFHSNGNYFISYIDLNGDGVLDQITTYAGSFKGLGEDGGKETVCKALGMSGIPAREKIFDLKICNEGMFDFEYFMWKGTDKNNLNNKKKTKSTKNERLIQTIPPAFFRSSENDQIQMVFLVNTGLISSFNSKGSKMWKIETNIHWTRHIEPITQPSLQVFSFESDTNRLVPFILAVGERMMAIVSEKGDMVLEQPLDSSETNPVMAPPIVGDFNNDGINDFLITTLKGYSIYITEKGTSSSLLPIIGMLLIGVLLVFLLSSSNDKETFVTKKLFSKNSFNKKFKD
ncbi:hypothetical protein DICPUDRAFT_98309 [Dictyostelium purpureum]|uniref:FG-GAP repeat-containing protein n=1 Tax=Dictyostelium purpureum TaxID=5786 RepID=F0ZPD4_DICPU|nr:uncharacterized protein DICPUDRAFT_98309 [Dictyostelium purpureum]EGC34171.1 hypothetical protein DICPUDRAFT_98309 [Dictyostelium purpureum]|eukprot:XP_003289275.1 hypothetical protein DICPUDRAFT_98309 [Dictyostelium purpureum]